MQNSIKSSAENMLGRSINGTEFAMMMEFAALPHFLKKMLGGMELCPDDDESKEKWDNASKEYFSCMSQVTGISWRSLHFALGLSLDNAPFHRGWYASMLTPRVPVLEEFRTVFTAAQKTLGIADIEAREQLDPAINRVRDKRREEDREIRAELAGEAQVLTAEQNKEQKKQEKNRRSALSRTINNINKYSQMEFIVAVLCRKFNHGPLQDVIAEAIVDELLAEYYAENAKFGDADTCWEEIFRRDMACKDRRWMCLVPEQVMPLGDTTPDLHQTAEMQVSTYKRIMRAWALRKDPDCDDLLLAQNYNEEMHKQCKKRNEGNDTGGGKDMLAISGSIRKLWIAAQIVAADRGKVFHPQLLPGYDKAKGGHETEMGVGTFTVRGSGGDFPEAKWS